MKNLSTGRIVTLNDNSKNSSYTGNVSTPGDKEFMGHVKASNGTIVSTNSVIVTIK